MILNCKLETINIKRLLTRNRILMGISSRLDALERAVVALGVQASRVERDLTALGEKPGPDGAIEELKKSIKDFTTALVLQVLSGEAPTDGVV